MKVGRMMQRTSNYDTMLHLIWHPDIEWCETSHNWPTRACSRHSNSNEKQGKVNFCNQGIETATHLIYCESFLNENVVTFKCVHAVRLLKLLNDLLGPCKLSVSVGEIMLGRVWWCDDIALIVVTLSRSHIVGIIVISCDIPRTY